MAAAEVQRKESLEYAPESYYIRSPRSSDIPNLEKVERSAAEIFLTANLGFLLDAPTVDPYLLASMANSGHLWVAVDRYDMPIGFIGGQYLEGNFHIIEVSVARAYQGRGIGKALMATMVDQIRAEGYKTITLTTYRDLPWNAPWYSRMGFVEVKPWDAGKIRYAHRLHRRTISGRKFPYYRSVGRESIPRERDRKGADGNNGGPDQSRRIQNHHLDDISRSAMERALVFQNGICRSKTLGCRKMVW
ncbi:uncharacterized protein PAC_14686 [Phialocephala subalpina]|uniref:N-acetyltransferase domain-containing protein n=1 Tax=Phialocephala subalpina TaxID=576137 RepID=A0A1L7XIK3_9HELO|nr:uncharacterized protein PAC_14686 [Phialocephala subalpina]